MIPAQGLRDSLARRGNRVICSCCGNTSGRLMPFGSPVRRHARCPHCHALERHRILWPYLQRLIQPGNRILHFAPEPVIARNIAQIPEVSYTAADLNPEISSLATEFPIVQADITKQPWPDDSFDVVIVSHVLEHVPDDLGSMRELRRVVTGSGVVVSQHPYDPNRVATYEDPTIVTPEDRARLFGQSDHVRVYGRDLLERWRRAGFQIEVLFADAAPGDAIIQASADK